MSFKRIVVASCVYVLLTGLVSAFYLFAILIQGLIVDFIGWTSVLLCGGVILASIINNLLILNNTSNIKNKQVLLNFWICVFQVIYITLDGFQFKYNQGLEVICYVQMENVSKLLTVGVLFENFNFAFNFKFLDSDFSSLGVNLISLCFCLTFLYYYRNNNAANVKTPSLV